MEVPQQMLGAQNFPALIDELQGELKRHRAPTRASGTRWRNHLHELALRRIKAPHDFLDWAKRDRRWSYTLAEVLLREAHARPAELAAGLAVAMVEQLED